ncbi:MAG TPA: helix-turn-helix domain-containing protein [Actinotalea sp.]|nr:helix-turn-helix domain-containing protein [Actinotalea sp.]
MQEEAAPTTASAPAVALGLRERQKRARRLALIDAAHRLVLEHGLDGVTVEEICVEAGVSTRTFFNYFGSKDDAVLGLTPHRLDPDLAGSFAAGGPTGNLSADIATLVAALVGSAPFGHGRLACTIELARREPRLLARHVATFEAHHAAVAGLLATRLDLPATAPRVELLTSVVMSLSRAAHLHREAGGGQGEVGDAVAAVLAELRGLLLEPGLDPTREHVPEVVPRPALVPDGPALAPPPPAPARPGRPGPPGCPRTEGPR